MSSSTLRRSIRVYPKHENVSDKMAFDICSEIVNNCKHLENQLQYRIENSSNFVGILFAATDGNHYLNLDFDKYNFWEIVASDYGDADWIREVKEPTNEKGETAIYTFDKIEFIGNQEKLLDFYEKIYDFKLKSKITEEFKKPKKRSVVINTKGSYTANNSTEIGQLNTRVPKKVDNFDLLNEFGGINKAGIETIEFQEDGFSFLDYFLNNIGTVGSTISKTDEIEQVKIYNQNKIVRKYNWIDDSPKTKSKHRYGYWECRNADSWENLVNIKWLNKTK